MLITPPPKFRKNRKAAKSEVAPVPAGEPLVLMAASYDGNNEIATLSFDRPIDVDRLNGLAIFLSDGDIDDLTFDGTGGTQMGDDNTVRIQLIPNGGASESGVYLTVSADSGIVAVNDGGTWVGVTQLGLPFP